MLSSARVAGGWWALGTLAWHLAAQQTHILASIQLPPFLHAPYAKINLQNRDHGEPWHWIFANASLNLQLDCL
ncbi:hypothetical protein N656DRAFT_780072 [Canariomyces notabilis]|uniref:Secreted protein n=1 Tax=Canariomyces notabilis TaxID=2074819 RepID=A0AAN6TCN1_9PEZI|nr:hypothetical protein N656DRAFT_780072 [Canariomyces arenarius]